MVYRGRRRGTQKDDIDRPKRNREIQARFVNVVFNGEFLNSVPIDEALQMAEEQELDLVLVDPKKEVPICKIIDYGKYIYDQQKKKKKKTKQKPDKGLRLTYNIADHDLMVRVKKASKFVSDGHKVNLEMRLRGREIVHKDVAKEKFDKFVKELRNVMPEFKISEELKLQGRVFKLTVEPDAKNQNA